MLEKLNAEIPANAPLRANRAMVLRELGRTEHFTQVRLAAPVEPGAIVELTHPVKAVLNEEIERLFEGFVQASVVAIEDIPPGERLTRKNVWVKRPGTGEIRAAEFEQVLGRVARRTIRKNDQQFSRVGLSGNT